jgi:pimeloyl-ACP methyl ester carboxylesterase
MNAIQERSSRSGRLKLRCSGKTGRPVLFLAGPPASSRLFDAVQERMAPQRSIAVDFLPGEGETGLQAMAEHLRALCEEEEVRILVAHGLAVPLAVQAVGPGLALLVISNGPTSKLDPVSKVLSRMPGSLLKKIVLHPKAFNAWLSSSLGLRRAVANPYVMDKETVARLTAPLLENAESRKQTAKWLRELPEFLPVQFPHDLDVVALWGDSDWLYPMEEVSEIEGVAVQAIAGGRFFHPQERPWEMADACMEFIAKSTT